MKIKTQQYLIPCWVVSCSLGYFSLLLRQQTLDNKTERMASLIYSGLYPSTDTSQVSVLLFPLTLPAGPSASDVVSGLVHTPSIASPASQIVLTA